MKKLFRFDINVTIDMTFFHFFGSVNSEKINKKLNDKSGDEAKKKNQQHTTHI